MSSYAPGSTDVPQPGLSTAKPVNGVDTPPRTAKIVLIGSASVGKTALRNRYFKGPKGFSQAYIATIGADFTTKTVEVLEEDNNRNDGGAAKTTKMSLQLWDTAGQERFQALGAAFYRGADACIIVYSCTEQTSAERIESWYNAFVERCPLKDGQEKTFPFICVGNKHDLVRSTDSNDLVDEVDVLETLKKLCPPAKSADPVEAAPNPSAIPIKSDTRSVQQQQEAELRGMPPPSASSRRRRGSSVSTKRRSLEILPDLPRPGSRGQSVYHTPSSSLINPSWAAARGSTQGSSSTTTGTPPAASSSGGTFLTSSTSQSADTVAGASTQQTASTTNNDQKADELADEDEDTVPPSLLDDMPPPPIPEESQEGDAVDGNEGPTDEHGVNGHNSMPAKKVFGAQDGIKHFYTSAKSGENVEEIFTYLSKRIAARWQWQEDQDRLYGFLDFDGEPGNIRTGRPNDSIKVGGKTSSGTERKGWRRGCC